MRVAINGFGRIGRLVLRAIVERQLDGQFEVVAINDLVPSDQLAYLLKYDSIHGKAPFAVSCEEEYLIVREKRIKVFSEKDPSKLPLKELQVDFVIEATGHFTEASDASKLLAAGAKKAIITAPAKGNIPTFVVGVNLETYNPAKDHIVSNASCTTNCLAPLAKILLDHFGIEEGLMTTIHSVTATQTAVDGASKKDWRGGRAASVNLIPSSTGAAKAVTLCIPQLQGKLTGMAIRVPTLDVSVVDLTVKLSKDTSYEEICKTVKTAAETYMQGIVSYCTEELVSSDFIGCTASCVFDRGAGIGLNSRFYKLIAWYDNEVGYSHRVVDLMNYMAHLM